MFIIGKYVYNDSPVGIIRCGEIILGIDGYYIQWYA